MYIRFYFYESRGKYQTKKYLTAKEKEKTKTHSMEKVDAILSFSAWLEGDSERNNHYREITKCGLVFLSGSLR